MNYSKINGRQVTCHQIQKNLILKSTKYKRNDYMSQPLLVAQFTEDIAESADCSLSRSSNLDQVINFRFSKIKFFCSSLYTSSLVTICISTLKNGVVRNITSLY